MERIASAARESAARDAGFYPTAWARDRDPRYRDETMDDCRTDANRVGIGRFESLSLYNGLSACGRLPLQMTSHGASLSSLAAGRALRIGLAACLLAMTGACSSTADQTGDAATPQARTSDAADLGPTIAPTWLPGVAPAAGGNLGDERDGAAGEADVADQGIWTLPGATATRSAAPRTMVAAV
ncbi:MAG TPA: hypothetical protein VMU85_04395, partial [Stellaceae bacterium]|nr:hypothetical protein [Stellaceae bacterium]